MLVDLALFSEEGFDAKAWINTAASHRPGDEPIERYLAEVEMKLQLLAEDVATNLEEQSAGALLRVPRAVREVNRVRDDALALRGAVRGILQRLEQVEGVSGESVAALSRVDVVKLRLEAARDTLQDAAGLASLSASVEEVFATGDLARVAETLAQMRRCLAVVGKVPEFADVQQQLGVLETRLEGMVQPRLAEALAAQASEEAQRLRNILLAIGRYSSIEQQYTRVRMRPLRKAWEEADAAAAAKGGARGAAFAEWLPQYYDEVLLLMEQEKKWCALAFPEEQHLLVPRLLAETMTTISSSFAARIEAACTEAEAGVAAATSSIAMGHGVSEPSGVGGAVAAGAARDGGRLRTLLSLHAMTGAFARNVQHLLAGMGDAGLLAVIRAVYLPFEGFKARYGALEKAQLSAEIGSLDLRPAVARSLGARGIELSETVRRMEASVPAVIVALESAVERCLAFTGGSEAVALLVTLDEVVVTYIGTLFDIIKSLRGVCGVPLADASGPADKAGPAGGGGDVMAEEDEWALVQGALQLLTVSESLGSRSAVFEASLRATLASLYSRLRLDSLPEATVRATSEDVPPTTPAESAGSASGGVMDIAALRLLDAPEKSRHLLAILDQAKDPRFHVLQLVVQRVQVFQEAVHSAVFDVLLLKVRQRLTDVATMSVWSAVEEENAFDLPKFSVSPLNYVTAIGEYLLTLPQQLEPLLLAQAEEVEEEDGQQLATEWMLKVAEGAAALYVDKLRAITSVSDSGALQLAADIEYLCNVLAALSLSPPLALLTFQMCMGCDKSKLAALERDPPSDADIGMLKLAARIRHVAPHISSA